MKEEEVAALATQAEITSHNNTLKLIWKEKQGKRKPGRIIGSEMGARRNYRVSSVKKCINSVSDLTIRKLQFMSVKSWSSALFTDSPL